MNFRDGRWDSNRGELVKQKPGYWFTAFSQPTWKEFRESDRTATGFKRNKRLSLTRVVPGDRLLCYVTGASSFVGVLEVVGKVYQNEHGKDDAISIAELPFRLPVQAIYTLGSEDGVAIKDIRRELVCFQRLENEQRWSALVRIAFRSWERRDGERVECRIAEKSRAYNDETTV